MCEADDHTTVPEGGVGAAADGTSRRTLFKGALAVGGAAVATGLLGAARPTPARADTPAAVPGDRILPLGLDGGPRVNVVPSPLAASKPALALVVNGQTYLVDCGLDTARQLTASGLGFANLHDVFVTHHHFDHTSGLPGLVLHGWTTQQRLTDVRLWGPPAMARQVNGIKTAFTAEIDLFGYGNAFGPFPTLVPQEVAIPPGSRIQRVMEDANVVVDATHVFHGPEVRDAYAYRFTIKHSGKVVVFSGDTAAPDANLIALAEGADVLVHEVQDNDNVEKLIASIPDKQQAAALRTHLLEAHSSVYDVPGVAKAAGVGTLVFSHYTPLPQPPAVYQRKAQGVADRIGYTGTIVAPLELQPIML